jgi:hypothetical protein
MKRVVIHQIRFNMSQGLQGSLGALVLKPYCTVEAPRVVKFCLSDAASKDPDLIGKVQPGQRIVESSPDISNVLLHLTVIDLGDVKSPHEAPLWGFHKSFRAKGTLSGILNSV